MHNYKIKETTLRDSVTTQRMQRNIAELEVQFDTEKKERQLVEKDLTIEKKNRLNNQILLILGALGIIYGLTLLFFRNRLKYQHTIAQQTEDIQQQKITDLQQKNKLLAMSSMIEGQEAEPLQQKIYTIF